MYFTPCDWQSWNYVIKYETITAAVVVNYVNVVVFKTRSSRIHQEMVRHLPLLSEKESGKYISQIKTVLLVLHEQWIENTFIHSTISSYVFSWPWLRSLCLSALVRFDAFAFSSRSSRSTLVNSYLSRVPVCEIEIASDLCIQHEASTAAVCPENLLMFTLFEYFLMYGKRQFIPIIDLFIDVFTFLISHVTSAGAPFPTASKCK